MKLVHMAAFALVIIGALNWGLIAVFDFNLLGTIFGAGTVLERGIYALVGVGALVLATSHWDDCKTCRHILKLKSKS